VRTSILEERLNTMKSEEAVPVIEHIANLTEASIITTDRIVGTYDVIRQLLKALRGILASLEILAAPAKMRSADLPVVWLDPRGSSLISLDLEVNCDVF
jgi:hypothetical protein